MADVAPLPGVLEEIADIAGRPTAIAIALAWGGREVHIPKPLHLARHPDHPLARLLEAEGTALKVSDYLGGSCIYLPRARSAPAPFTSPPPARRPPRSPRASGSPPAPPGDVYIRGAPLGTPGATGTQASGGTSAGRMSDMLWGRTVRRCAAAVP